MTLLKKLVVLILFNILTSNWITIEDDTKVLWSGRNCGCDSDEMGLKWAGNADADKHNVSLPSVGPGASVLIITGSNIVAGTDQR